jgi:hypothetical protein
MSSFEQVLMSNTRDIASLFQRQAATALPELPGQRALHRVPGSVQNLYISIDRFRRTQRYLC